MRKILYLIFLLASITLSAQEIADYPQYKNIQAGEYDKAADKLHKKELKDIDDIRNNYALGILYSEPAFSNFNAQKAYAYMCRALDTYLQKEEKDIQKLQKDGYTQSSIQSGIDRTAEAGLSVVDLTPSVAAYDAYLNDFNRASSAVIAAATNKRNEQAFLLACQENTEVAYHNFVLKYPEANENGKAINRRDSIAYDAARRVHNIESYTLFLSKYPKAIQAGSAKNALYTLAYANARAVHTEDVYKDYMKQYTESHLLDSATYWFHQLEMERLTNDGTWRSYRMYINQYSRNKPQVKQVEEKMYALASKLQNIEQLNYGHEHFYSGLADSCLFVLHDVYANTSSISDLRTFHELYDDNILKDLRKKDEYAIAAYGEFRWGDGTLDDFIRAAAPYRCAYEALISQIEDDLKSWNWQNALNKAQVYETAFGGDHRYRDLINTLSRNADNVRISPFPSTVNTTNGDEYALTLTADGKTIYFTGKDRTDNIGGEDIYMSRKSQGQWTQAKVVRDLSTDYTNDSPESVSADGTTMLLFKSGKLYESEKNKYGWSYPTRLSENINICDWQADAMVTSDGRALLFAAKKQTPHEIDESTNIYVSVRDVDGEWSEPIDLGPTINTSATDRSPFLHPDMKTLYFCSNGHSTLGGLDVFVSTRLSENSWTEWSEPVNIGREINTTETECWYKISTDGTTAYFSKHNGKHQNLYQLNLPESMRPMPVATIGGYLKEKTGEPVSATIRWEDLESGSTIGQSQTDPTDGSYFVVLPEGKIYGYYVDHQDYYPIANNLDLRNTSKVVQVNKDIEMVSFAEMISNNVPAPLNNLFFEVGKSELLPYSISELKRVAQIIKERNLNIEISGHTDSTGDAEKNQILSEERAKAAYDFLVEQGCEENSLSYVGYGASKPIADNKTEVGRQKNRRIEVRFVAK